MLILNQKQGFIRSVDIAEQLGVTKPSVSYATKRLREEGHINMTPDGLISLTRSGLKIAQRIYERHTVLSELFIKMGVDPETAMEDACRVEHDISEETFAALKKQALSETEK